MECIEFIQCNCRAAAAFALAVTLAHAAPSLTNNPPALTSSWKKLWTQDIPLKASNAIPFVAAVDPHERLWLANQRERQVYVYNRQGLRRDRVRGPRGTVTTISFDSDGGLAMVASQRGEMRWPLGDYYLFSMDRTSGRHIVKTRDRTYPQYLTSRSASDELELCRRRGEFTAAASPSNIVRWTMALSPRGTVAMVLPVFSIIERHGADGRTVATSLADTLRPWSPCWIVATEDDQYLVGDALGRRIVLFGPAMKPVASWPRDNAARLMAAPRPDRGWMLLDPLACTVEIAGAGAGVDGTWSLPPGQWCAALMPRRTRLWLFESTTWTWHAYDRKD